jgi:2-polyprenyl-6-methoxyphenol hydroxylase-like FAD-dependent oxidoreductase
VAGGGIGGLAAALALVRQGFKVKVLEQAPEIGEIGAGIQLGPNAFHAFRRAGRGRQGAQPRRLHRLHGDARRARRIPGRPIPTGEAFRQRFGNPYAVIHRVDVHLSLLEGAQETGRWSSTPPRAWSASNRRRPRHRVRPARPRHHGQALIGADGVRSVVRAQYVNDPPRVTGHVVYRAVIDKKDFPPDLQWNAASIWVGPNCHLVHYPLRGGEQYNVVVTFHSRSRKSGASPKAAAKRCRATSRASAPRRAS